MTNSAHFTPALFEFLSELADNNNREWFQDNKARYERDVRDALVQFVADFGKRLQEISPHMVADPRLSGGYIFRSEDTMNFKTFGKAYPSRHRPLRSQAAPFVLTRRCPRTASPPQ